jgi:hypothetical protein
MGHRSHPRCRDWSEANGSSGPLLLSHEGSGQVTSRRVEVCGSARDKACMSTRGRACRGVQRHQQLRLPQPRCRWCLRRLSRGRPQQSLQGCSEQIREADPIVGVEDSLARWTTPPGRERACGSTRAGGPNGPSASRSGPNRDRCRPSG